MRRPANPNRPRRSRMASFAAPTGGWVKNQNLAIPDPNRPPSAEMLVNFFPTATGVELRGGSLKYATLGDGTEDVRSFLRYKNGPTERLFAAVDSAIYDITIVSDPDESPAAAVDDLSGSLWSSTQFATTGGVFLVGVNGADDLRLYDGQYWYPISDKDLHLLRFVDKTDDFTIGALVTGSSSGATGIIVTLDNTPSGFVVLIDVENGPFHDNETITDSQGGSATTQGIDDVVFVGLTGVDTDDLVYVWSYNYRLFFIERDSMNVWYAPIDQIGGSLVKFPMGGVFPLGGSLSFGASWSLDSGAEGGLSDQCIFVTSEGEVAVYQGNNPASASDWRLVGVYRIGKPLGPEAKFRAGGDIIVDTDIGMIPLSQAINRDVAALSPVSVSYPIETAWNEAVSFRRSQPWHSAVWPEKQMVLTALPTPDGEVPRMYATNSRTGAWCEFTGWDGRCLMTFQGRMFFGSSEGRVVEAYVTGLDQGQSYIGIFVPLFTDLGSGWTLKIPETGRAVTRSNIDVQVNLSVQFDYVIDIPPAPDASIVNSGSFWGIAIWGEAIWGASNEKIIKQDTVSLSGSGYAFAPALQITSGSLAAMAAEIVRIDVTYSMGDIGS